MKALTTSFENYDKQDFAKSAVLYVLQHFQPSLRKKIASKHYLKKTIIDLTPDEQPDLEKIISSEIEFVANQVSFSANWFSTDDYLKLWKKYFAKFLNEHVEIQEFLQTFESDFPEDTNEQFGLMIDSLTRLTFLLKTSYNEWHRKSMAEFLESNLPLELYNLYNLSYIEKISVMKSLVGDLIRLQGRLHLVRANERKIRVELTKFEKQQRKLSGMFAKLSRSELTLRFFLRSNNAQELEDLFKTKPLTLNSNTEDKFTVYFNKFKQSLTEMTSFLDEKYLDEDMVLNSSESESFRDFDEKLRQIVLKHA